MTRRLAVAVATACLLLPSSATGTARPPAAVPEPSPVPEWGATATLHSAPRVTATQLVTGRGPDRTVVAGWWRQVDDGVGELLVATRKPGSAWSGPTAIGRGQVPSAQWLAVDGSGAITAVWRAGQRVLARSKPSDAGWRPPVRINPNLGHGYLQRSPEIAVNRAGAAAATWSWSSRFYWGYAAVRTANGTWRPAVRRAKGDLWDQSVTIDRHGNVMRYYETSFRVWVERYEPGSGWGSPRPLFGSTSNGASVDGNEAGLQVAVTTRDTGVVLSRQKRPGSAWTPLREIGRASDFSRYEVHEPGQVVVDGRGRATVVFSDEDAGSALAAVLLWWDDDASRWRTRHTIVSPPDARVHAISITVDETGNWLAGWMQRSAGSGPVVWASYRRPGLTWSLPARVSPRSTHRVVDVDTTMRPDGVPVIAWLGNQGREAPDWLRYRVRQALPESISP